MNATATSDRSVNGQTAPRRRLDRNCSIGLPARTLETHCAIGRIVARYAKGLSPLPVGVKVDNGGRLRLIVKTMPLHFRETGNIWERAPLGTLLSLGTG